jgi:hypothetical protein
MRSALAGFAAVLWMACNTVSALAQQCSLADFDKGPPKSVKDVTPPTNDSKFAWGSDVDPWGTDARGWHYITNLHNKKLSLDWKKPGLLIPFDKPLDPNETFCKFDYGSLDSYKLDRDAPIIVSNDGVKSAQAYVQSVGKQDAAKPSVTGAELRRTYHTIKGEITSAFARILFRYYDAEKVLQLDVTSGPGEVRVGLGLGPLGMIREALFSQSESRSLKFEGPIRLEKLVREDETKSMGVNPDQNVVVINAGDYSLKFGDISVAPSGATPMLLIAPDGKPLALTSIKLDLLGSAK